MVSPEQTTPGSCAAVIHVSDEDSPAGCYLSNDEKTYKTSEFIRIHEAGTAIKLNISIAQLPVAHSVKPGKYTISSDNTDGEIQTAGINVVERELSLLNRTG